MKSALLALLCLLLCHAGIAAGNTPTKVLASYDVYMGQLRIGRIEEQFNRKDDHYRITSITRATGWLALFNSGSIVINSSGMIDKTGLRPLKFSDEREDHEDRNRRAELDWSKRQLTLIEHSRNTTVSLPDRTQDRLSAMYQFMFLELQPGSDLFFPMTNGGKLDDYRYSIVRKEKLNTPAGLFETLYLDNQANPGENRTQIWLSTENHNLPCKLIITEANGDEITQVLRNIEIKP
jgi:hypothetical protein